MGYFRIQQQELFDLITGKDSKIIFVNGPAGTAKTLFGAYAGLTLLNQKKVSDIIFIRSVIESASRSLGHLPGLASEKFEPFTMPLKEKMHELLPAKDVETLLKDKRIDYLPINFARGASFNVKYILGDECQNMTSKEILTLITRLGKHSKIVLCGDAIQSDINGQSGFMKFFDLFNDETSRSQGIHCFSFTRDDIVRNGLLKYIMERVEGQIPSHKPEPMFPAK
jgi:phosphate starvation-inducible PhoH-like protein